MHSIVWCQQLVRAITDEENLMSSTRDAERIDSAITVPYTAGQTGVSAIVWGIANEVI